MAEPVCLFFNSTWLPALQSESPLAISQVLPIFARVKETRYTLRTFPRVDGLAFMSNKRKRIAWLEPGVPVLPVIPARQGSRPIVFLNETAAGGLSFHRGKQPGVSVERGASLQVTKKVIEKNNRWISHSENIAIRRNHYRPTSTNYPQKGPVENCTTYRA